LFATSGVSRAHGISIIGGSRPGCAALNSEVAATHTPDIRSVSINRFVNSLGILIVPPLARSSRSGWPDTQAVPCKGDATRNWHSSGCCAQSCQENTALAARYFSPVYPSGSSPERLCLSFPHLPPIRPSPVNARGYLIPTSLSLVCTTENHSCAGNNAN